MNHKGDVTITMLVIGIFAVCTIALISFFQSSVEVRNSLVGFNLVEKMNADIESYTFAQKDSLKDLQIKTDAGGDYFSEEEKVTSGSLWWKKEKIAFYLKYYIK